MFPTPGNPPSTLLKVMFAFGLLLMVSGVISDKYIPDDGWVTQN